MHKLRSTEEESVAHHKKLKKNLGSCTLGQDRDQTRTSYSHK